MSQNTRNKKIKVTLMIKTVKSESSSPRWMELSYEKSFLGL